MAFGFEKVLLFVGGAFFHVLGWGDFGGFGVVRGGWGESQGD